MHKGAVGAICIDIPAAQIEAATTFWRAALGVASRAGTEHPEFELLDISFSKVAGLLQAVGDDDARVHLDVHTDDVEAETARLVALGATEVQRLSGWIVLRDPAGLVFCVVHVESDDPLLSHARTFDD